jgi:O-antigen/teichoic acid export membrane protein
MATGTGLGRQEAAALMIDAGDAPRGLRALLADSLVYGIAVAAVPAAALLATPILARVLDPAGYGTLDVLASLLALATVVALAGLDQAVTRGFFDHGPGERAERRDIVRTGLTLALAASGALAVALAVIGAVVQGARGERLGTEVGAAAAAALVVLPLATTQTIARLPFLLERRRWTYVGVGLLQAGAGMAAAVALVVAGLGPAGYFLGLALGAACALGLTLARTRILPSAAFSRARVSAMLRYGIPLVPATVMAWVIFAVDRSLIVSFRDLEEAGYYGIASRATAPLLLAVSAFGVAWSPIIMSQARSRQPELRARALTGVLAVAGGLFLLLVLFSEPLVRLLGGGEYLTATRAVPGLALGWVGWAAATVLLTEFAVTRRTSTIAVVAGLAAAANVLLNLVLIPPYGFEGAAWATAASFWVMALIAWICERRLTVTPYRWTRLAVVALAIAAVSPAATLGSEPVDIAVKAVAASVALAVLFLVAAGDRGRDATRVVDAP